MNERPNLNKIYRQLTTAGGGSLVAARILDSERVNDKVAKVVVRFSTEASKEHMRQALSRALNGQACGIDDTFTQVEAGTGLVFVGYVAHNPEVREFTKADQAAVEARAAGSYRVVAKNMLLDEKDKSLWETRESAGGKFLVRTGKEDLSELLSSVAAPTAQLNTKRLLASSNFAGTITPRSFVQFLDRDLAEVGHGYVLESTAETVKILAFGGGDEPMEVPSSDVIQIADFEGEDTEQAAIEIPASSADAKKLRDYFQQLFGKAGFFFSKMTKMINDGTKF